jgi:hypothetical protein
LFLCFCPVVFCEAPPSGPNLFVLTQVGKVQQLLVPCFALPDEPRVRERLGALLELVTRRYRATSPPPSFLASGFYQRLKEARLSHLIVFIRIRLNDWFFVQLSSPNVQCAPRFASLVVGYCASRFPSPAQLAASRRRSGRR